MGKENNKHIGSQWEEKAARWLSEQGYRILALNFRSRFGEIDIVAKDGRYLVFIEVKYRRSSGYGDGAYAVNTAKQRKICQTASYFLMTKHYNVMPPIRFDVVTILGEEISLYKNAFSWVM